MGTCISKCCLNNDNNNNNPSTPPQDKLVISQSPHPASSSSSSSTSSSKFSSCTSVSTCSSSSSTPMFLRLKPYSNDFLLSCAKENPHIIVLEPYHAPKPKPQGIANPVPTRRQRNHCSVRLPAKRERRSSSPQQQQQQQRSIARQKSSSGGEMIVKQPAVVSEPIRTLSSPNNVLPKDKQRVRGRSEKIRPLSPCNSLNRLNLKENPLVEDTDNPLISMECFIFL